VSTPDLIALVEAAYDLEPDDREWLAQLVTTAAPHLDVGRGIFGFYFDASDRDRVRMWHPTDVGETTMPMKMRLGRDVAVGREPDVVAWIATSPTSVGSLTDVLREIGSLERLQPWITLSGHLDYLGVRACDAQLRGVALAACYPAPFSAPAPTRHRWSRVAAHIAAGYRLRRSLHIANVDQLVDDGEAVLGPDGRVHHAEAPASGVEEREHLRRAVLDVDRARTTRRRRDTEEALELWRGLVDGTWSLVERFESDGRRYFVARRNEPGVLDPRGLTLREKQVVSFASLGHSDKLIAYELGVTKSTVATHLKTAMHKLGVGSRVALIRLLNDLGLLGELLAPTPEERH
jgi:DNA-binding CsgD family transcriptional regulator